MTCNSCKKKFSQGYATHSSSFFCESCAEKNHANGEFKVWIEMVKKQETPQQNNRNPNQEPKSNPPANREPDPPAERNPNEPVQNNPPSQKLKSAENRKRIVEILLKKWKRITKLNWEIVKVDERFASKKNF